MERGYSYAAAEESLGATSWSIRQWVKKFRASGELASNGEGISSSEKLKKLHKELKQLRMEHVNLIENSHSKWYSFRRADQDVYDTSLEGRTAGASRP